MFQPSNSKPSSESHLLGPRVWPITYGELAARARILGQIPDQQIRARLDPDLGPADRSFAILNPPLRAMQDCEPEHPVMSAAVGIGLLGPRFRDRAFLEVEGDSHRSLAVAFN